MARRYEVNANQLFGWRKLFGPPGLDTMAPGLVPVVLTGEVPSLAAPISPDDRVAIELAGGYRIRVGGEMSVSMVVTSPYRD